MFERFKNVLRSPEGDGTGAAGGGSHDPLGDATPPAAPPAAPAAGTPPAAPAGTPPPAADWRSAFPEELRNQEFMKKYETPEALAKAYGNLEKMIGRDKVVIPQKGAALADMKEYFEKIGLPKLEEYKLEGFDPKVVDPEFLDGYKKVAHGLNMLPEQAKGLVDWFTKTNEEAIKQQAQLMDKAVKADLDAYKAETGDAYTTEVARAKAALKSLDAKDQEFLQKSGLTKNTAIIRMLAKYGATLAEGSIKGEGGRVDGVLTPSQALEKINEIKSNIKGAYYDSSHADHAKVKKEMAQYYSWAYPDTSKKQPEVKI